MNTVKVNADDIRNYGPRLLKQEEINSQVILYKYYTEREIFIVISIKAKTNVNYLNATNTHFDEQ